jgi:thiosulfate dehydrogenase [quinone] large subunit
MDFGKRSTAFLLVEALVGYEWLASGLTKLVHGDFPGGLAATLGDMGKQSPAWYRGFLDAVVIPHAQAFGYAIELGELMLGVVLLAAAAISLLHDRRGDRIANGLIAVCAGVGLFLAANLELANGAHFGLPIAGDSFDEGIDLDTIMVGLQLVLLGSAVAALRAPRARARVARLASVFASLR